MYPGILETIRRIVEKEITLQELYSKEYQTAYSYLFSKFVVIDLITPIASIIRGAAYDVRKSFTVTSDQLSTDEVSALNNIVRSEEWNKLWGSVVNDILIYGRAFVRPFIDENGRMRFWRIPPFAETKTNPITGELLYLKADWRGTVSQWSAVYDTERILEINDGAVVLDQANDLGLVPAVFVRSPNVGSNSDYPIPVTFPAVSLSILATMYVNDVTVLSHLQSFSTLVITGAESDDVTLSPAHVISMSNPQANAQWITPQSKIADIDAISDKMLYRAAILCGLPPDIVRFDTGIAGSAAGSVAARYAALRNLASRIRAEITDGMKEALSLLLAMCYGVSKDEAFQMYSLDARYETDVSAQITTQDVEAWRRAVEYKLVDFETARRYFNPDEVPEKTAQAKEDYENAFGGAAMIKNYDNMIGVI